ncbi:glycosyltransferase family 2 protein [Maioricimonas rarisocia]|nr:glycosyltransferase family A protein [Maioricimonas rarisocia]
MTPTTETPTISAVVPAYNAADTIARTIQSILDQTLPVCEVIVVDDGSKDETARIIDRFGAPVRRITQENAGPNAARNHGVREARGEWIAFLDSDDRWLPNKLERMLPLLQDDPQTGVVHCYTVDERSWHKYDGELTFDMLWDHNYVGTSTAIVRKAAWKSVGGFDEDRSLIGAEDYNMWLRMAARDWKFRLCPEELVEYTPAEGSLSSQVRRVLEGELLNARRIAEFADLPAERLRQRERELYAEYGVAMFHARDRQGARQFLGAALKTRPSVDVLARWLATWLPDAVWKLRRRVPQSAA